MFWIWYELNLVLVEFGMKRTLEWGGFGMCLIWKVGEFVGFGLRRIWYEKNLIKRGLGMIEWGEFCMIEWAEFGMRRIQITEWGEFDVRRIWNEEVLVWEQLGMCRFLLWGVLFIILPDM